MGKKIEKKNLKTNFETKILENEFETKILKKKFRRKILKKKFWRKILKIKFCKKNFGKKFWQKDFGKINYKTKIFIAKIYSNIDKCHTIFSLLAPFDKTGWKTRKTSMVYDSK